MFLGEDDERQYLYPPEFHRGFFRLAVGLEDTDDLIRDIDHALGRPPVFGPSPTQNADLPSAMVQKLAL